MLLLLFASDSLAIGCVDSSSLTDLQCVELLYTPFDPSKLRQQLGGNEEDVCSFHGVGCGPTSRVQRIEWVRPSARNPRVFRVPVRLAGSIDFAYLPPAVRSVRMYNQNLVGTIDATVLPDVLKELSLADCNFTGTIILENLPRELNYFSLRANRITGLKSIENIPKTVRMIHIEENIKNDLENCSFLEIVEDKKSPLQDKLSIIDKFIENDPKISPIDKSVNSFE